MEMIHLTLGKKEGIKISLYTTIHDGTAQERQDKDNRCVGDYCRASFLHILYDRRTNRRGHVGTHGLQLL